MRFDEIFPRSKFPLRAKTKVKIPETDLSMRISVYYQNPPSQYEPILPHGPFPSQTFGMCKIISLGKDWLLAYANLFVNSVGKGTVFVCKHNDWIEITDNDAEMQELVGAERIIVGGKYNGFHNVYNKNTKWKQF